MLFPAALAVAAGGLSFPASAQAADSGLADPDRVRRAALLTEATVHLTIFDESGDRTSSGTGFFISSDGVIVTNEHVIQGAHSVRATLADGRELAVTGWLARDADRDVALLQAEGNGYRALELGTSNAIRVGEPVWVMGAPVGLQFTLGEGFVSAVRENGLPEAETPVARQRNLQLDLSAAPGSSGSPVIDDRDWVIGVIWGIKIAAGNANLTFAVPVEVVRELLANRTDAPQRFANPATWWIKLAGSLAFFAGIYGVLQFLGRRRGHRISYSP